MTAHATAIDASGRVTCACGEESPRIGTLALQRQWIADHKRQAKEASAQTSPSSTSMLADLRRAIGLKPGQALCAYTNYDGQQCLKPEGHADIVGEGWHMGLGWTSSGRKG